MNLRDALCCRFCGRRPASRERYHRGFEYHHLVPVREGGPGVAGNIVLLCRRCHRLADAGALDPDGFDAEMPRTVRCCACSEPLDLDAAEVNCGLYRCPACGETTHLYDHFGYGEGRSQGE